MQEQFSLTKPNPSGRVVPIIRRRRAIYQAAICVISDDLFDFHVIPCLGGVFWSYRNHGTALWAPIYLTHFDAGISLLVVQTLPPQICGGRALPLARPAGMHSKDV